MQFLIHNFCSKVEKKGEKRPRLIDKSENKDDTENNLPMTRLIDKAESKDKPKNNSPSKTKLTDKLENLSRKIKLIDKAENKDDLEKKLSSKTKVIDKLENKPEKNLSKMKLIDKSENKVEKNLSNRTMSSTATNVSNTESQSSYFDLTNSLSPEVRKLILNVLLGAKSISIFVVPALSMVGYRDPVFH